MAFSSPTPAIAYGKIPIEYHLFTSSRSNVASLEYNQLASGKALGSSVRLWIDFDIVYCPCQATKCAPYALDYIAVDVDRTRCFYILVITLDLVLHFAGAAGAVCNIRHDPSVAVIFNHS